MLLWLYDIKGLIDFHSTYKILFAVHLKHSSVVPAADPTPVSNYLAHAMPRVCMFALSMCILLSL